MLVGQFCWLTINKEEELTVNKFFAIVGPYGAGKSTLVQGLRQDFNDELCTFLCDSRGCGDMSQPHTRFVTGVTQIAQELLHQDVPAISQLLFFWARLSVIIENEVVPSIRAGKHVIMDGFGGTVLVHAMIAARDDKERERLLALHKQIITHCVFGYNLSPPTYIWLQPSADVAEARLRRVGKAPLSSIEAINNGFDFYGTLEGQTVIPVNADQDEQTVLNTVRNIIGITKENMVH